MSRGRVIVGLSGGVDSAVAALLLKEQGYEVAGVHMSVWDPASSTSATHTAPKRDACYCPGDTSDRDEAKLLADKLGIPFQVLDVSAEYSRAVLDYFSEEYSEGRTPNPCVACNQKIKFGALLDKVTASGFAFDYFATGHYVKKHYLEKENRYTLETARDASKDQTYFLYRLQQKQLERCLFPLGDLLKTQVKAMAAAANLGVEDKPESQNFVNGDYAYLLKTPTPPGWFKTTEGRVLGQHRGIAHYTVGQRRGLGISSEKPLYVLSIHKKDNVIIVGTEEQLSQSELTVRDLSWMAMGTLQEPRQVTAKIRYASPSAQCTVIPLDQDRATVRFSVPQRAVTPGQSVVFYEGNLLLGGGVIC